MAKTFVRGANPYMPLWEHVPDGEPRVFEYQGEKRVYVYGSHDTERTQYCGPDYVVWSAPVTDLTDWTYHGVCYREEDGGILYAPDVVQKGDTFYMYAAERKGSQIVVATSKTPWGPFTNPVKTELGFDPGILPAGNHSICRTGIRCSARCRSRAPEHPPLRVWNRYTHISRRSSGGWKLRKSNPFRCGRPAWPRARCSVIADVRGAFPA